jgi:hypothetical protein
MNSLHDAGFTDWEVKRAIGKEIPTTDSTYLQGLSRKLSEKFPQVYNNIRLTGYMNKNGLRVDELEQKVLQQEQTINYLITMNEILRQSIPSENIVETIRKLRKEGKVTLEQIELMKKSGIEINE